VRLVFELCATSGLADATCRNSLGRCVGAPVRRIRWAKNSETRLGSRHDVIRILECERRILSLVLLPRQPVTCRGHCFGCRHSGFGAKILILVLKLTNNVD
jgi:hypothetical protein